MWCFCFIVNVFNSLIFHLARGGREIQLGKNSSTINPHVKFSDVELG